MNMRSRAFFFPTFLLKIPGIRTPACFAIFAAFL